MISNEQKEMITARLQEFIARYPSQNKAVNALKGTSTATVSSIINHNWDKISDAMWMRIASQISSGDAWTICETAAYQSLQILFEDAQSESNVMWVIAPAGTGKSTAAKEYARSHRNVFLLQCSEDMHKVDFIRELAALIGISAQGLTVRETLATIIKELSVKDAPLLIFDEGDKLTDTVLYYYVSLYNALEDKCGMVFLSTNYMQERLRKGVMRGKKGYDELDSRLCRRFISLQPVNTTEVIAICRANGLNDETAISSVCQEAAECANDLRRVKRSIHKQLKKLSLKIQ